MKKLKRLLAIMLTVCIVMTLFVAPVTANGQTFYSYDVDGGQICMMDGGAYYYGVKYYNNGYSEAGRYDPNGLILWSTDTTITKAVIPSTYTGYASSSSGGTFEYGEGPYIEDEPITAIQGISSGSISGAFAGCTLLTSVTIPSTVKYIYGGAFAGCTSLTEVILEDNDYYYYADGAIYTKDMTTLVCYIDGSRTSFVVPDGVTEIGDFAFVGAPSLTSITIPASVTTIGTGALTGTGLTSVTFEQGSPFTAENNLIFNADKTKVISYYGDVNGLNIPISVTEISDYAFWGVTCNSSIDGGYLNARRCIYNVYYQGTEEQWEEVTVGETNVSSSTDLNVYYSCYVYSVDIDDVDNGYISVSGNSEGGVYSSGGNGLYAEEGVTFTLSISGDIGYALSDISVTDDEGKSVDVTLAGSHVYQIADCEYYTYTYTFEMPASNVEVSVSFEQVSDGSLNVIHTFTQDDLSAYTFNFSDYLTDYSAGDYILITAVLRSDSPFVGTLSADSAYGSAQNIFSGSTSEPVVVYLSLISEYDYPDGNGKIELMASAGTYVNLNYLGIQKITPVECTHANLTHVDATTSTCTDAGNIEYWCCSTCGKFFSDENATTEISLEDVVIGLTDHTTEVENAKEVTCTEDGYTGDKVCTVCGETIESGEVISALGHTEAEAVKENEVAATCAEPGSYDSVVYCTVCDEELSRETVTVPALGHIEGEAVKENEVAATCADAGSYDSVVYCTVCGEELSRETVTVSALGHTEGEAVKENEVEATCTEAGSYDSVVYCTVCGEELSRETITIPAAHTESSEVRENYFAPTATATGSYDLVVYCSVCGEELSRKTVIVPATGSTVNLATIRADYSAVNSAIAKANSLNADDYINFNEVTDAINAVNWSYSMLHQSIVAAMAEDIETAISNLISVDTVLEEVTINDPVEDTDTSTEEDEPESEPEVTESETNPTTGIAISLLPMAIAALAVISSKRK